MALESKLQGKIIKDAEKKGYYVVKIIRCNKKGFPDLQIFGRGRVAIFIECKAEEKEAEELQKFRHKQLIEFGFKVYSNIDTWEKYLAIGL